MSLKSFKPHEVFPVEGIDETPIVVLSSFDTLAFHKVEGGHLFFRIEKPLSASLGEIAQYSFGFGKSPTNIERTHLLFAYAWGKAIQLVVMTHTKKGGTQYDGYYNYPAEKTCNYLCFLSESILIAVFNQKEV